MISSLRSGFADHDAGGTVRATAALVWTTLTLDSRKGKFRGGFGANSHLIHIESLGTSGRVLWVKGCRRPPRYNLRFGRHTSA
jgi:hypothetical protein